MLLGKESAFFYALLKERAASLSFLDGWRLNPELGTAIKERETIVVPSSTTVTCEKKKKKYNGRKDL